MSLKLKTFFYDDDLYEVLIDSDGSVVSITRFASENTRGVELEWDDLDAAVQTIITTLSLQYGSE